MIRRPAAFLFISALMGAFFGFTTAQSPYLIFWILLAAILSLAIPRNIVRIAALLLCTGLLAALSSSLEKTRYFLARNSLPQTVSLFDGLIIDVAQQEDGSKVLIAESQPRDQPETSFKLKIFLSAALSTLSLAEGQSISFKGQARPFLPPLSPVHFDAERFGMAHHLHGSLALDDPLSFEAYDKRVNFFWALLREKIRRHALEHLSPKEAALLLALMIGDTHLFSDEQSEVFKKIGAQHLLAISGLQVTLLSSLSFFLAIPFFCLLLARSRSHRAIPLAALFTVIVSAAFIALTGWQSSAIRAFLMAAFMLVRTICARRVDIFDAFFLSGFFTLMIAPSNVLDLGYLLSFAAVFGLIGAHHLVKPLIEKLKNSRWLLSFSLTLFVSSLGTFIATLPITLIYFGQWAPATVLANLFLVPIAALLQVPAIILGLLGCLLNWPLAINFAAFFSNLIEIMAEFLADAMGYIVEAPAWSKLSLILLLFALVALGLAALKRKKIFLLASISLLCSGMLMERFLKQEKLEVTVMAVGQGDATLFSLPSGHHLLVDAGGLVNSDFDPGARIVVPTLRRKGIRTIDALIITHPDPDHILGAFAILEQIEVKEIWHSGYRADHPLTKKLYDIAFSKKIPIKDARALRGSHAFGDVTIEVLAPMTFDDEPYYSELSANDNSLVLRVVYGQNALLWPGDIEYFGERLLLSSGLDLRAQILKAPHHGSNTSSSPLLIDAVAPRYVIYSTGQNNRFGFPKPQVVSRYQEKNVTSFDTAVDGEVTITLTKNSIDIDGFRPSLKNELHALSSALPTKG